MLKLDVENEVMESALCVGVIAAVVWGVGLSLYGLQPGTSQISWLTWSIELLGGILACLVLPPAYVMAREWVQERLHPQVEPLQRQG